VSISVELTLSHELVFPILGRQILQVSGIDRSRFLQESSSTTFAFLFATFFGSADFWGPSFSAGSIVLFGSIVTDSVEDGAYTLGSAVLAQFAVVAFCGIDARAYELGNTNDKQLFFEAIQLSP
jgi:hypothetical protein